MLMLTMMFPLLTMGGSEEEPEIEDYNQNDRDDIFGAFARSPALFTFFQVMGLFPFNSLDVIDIHSAWFYEQAEEPTYLFTALKLEDLFLIKQLQIYSIKWTYNGKEYSTSVRSHMMNGVHTLFKGGASGIGGTYEEIDGSFDFEKNIIHFKVPKYLIGNPQPGDVLTKTNAWTALRFAAEPLTLFLGGELAKDWSGYGMEYTIQY